VKASEKSSDVVQRLNEIAGFPPDEDIELNEVRYGLLTLFFPKNYMILFFWSCQVSSFISLNRLYLILDIFFCHSSNCT
jgi:hypothetical protein